MSVAKAVETPRARVLQVVLGLDPGGTERLVVELVRRLHARQPMAVCCLDDAGLWGRELREEGIAVTTLARRSGFHPLLGRRVASTARQHRATIIHAHHYSPFVYSALARPWGGPPVVFTEHGRLSDTGPSAKRRWANQVLAHGARRVFTVSRELGAHLEEEGFPPSKISVVYNGISVGPIPLPEVRREVRTELGVDDGVVVIATIARLDPVKDLGTLIRAVGRLAGTERVLLVVIGEGTERPTLEREAAEAGLSAAVKFLGLRSDARRWLSGCDVYVNSSVSEGVSLTILEAMAAQLPIVATAVGGTPEVVTSDCGDLVQSRDVEGLANAIRALCRDPNRRAQLGHQARDRVEQVFTIERMVADYSSAYEAHAAASDS
jgi:L-malate glycosyltransferase